MPSASAFSLAGPLASGGWMTTERGYSGAPGTGPMNLGEGYRWNMPTITYGFDPVFVEYFGSNGVYAIEQAIKVLNDLPAASQTDLTKFPLSTSRENYRAGALLLRDLKSTALSVLLNYIGLDIPELYVWTVRHEYHLTDGTPVYYVIKRNFDPFTFEPTSYINGTLYTYSLFHSDSPHFAFTQPSPVDPSLPAAFSVAAFSAPGQYFTGLTRDDVGGLRYLYRSQNMVVETLPNNVTNSGLPFFSGSSGGSPWVPITVTNNLATNAAGTTATFVNVALRRGVEKLAFVRVNFDQMLGGFLGSTNAFVDTFYLNGSAQSQSLLRIEVQPDILFTAGDNGIVDDFPVQMINTGTGNWVNNGSTNNISGLGGVEWDGPGNINPPMAISFTKLGRFFRNVSPTDERSSTPYYFWGSYDGSTNEPIVYPSGTSIRALEQQIFGY